MFQNRVPTLTMFAASSLLVGDKLPITDEQGYGCLVAVGPEFQVVGVGVGVGEFEDTFWATPAVANDAIYFRGVNSLSGN